MKPKLYVKRAPRPWSDYLLGGFLVTLGLGVFYVTVEVGRAWIFR